MGEEHSLTPRMVRFSGIMTVSYPKETTGSSQWIHRERALVACAALSLMRIPAGPFHADDHYKNFVEIDKK